MLTTDIRQRVRQNLNRDDVGIDARIQGWVNDAKRVLEDIRNFEYMRAQADLTVSGASPSASLPDRFKSLIEVRYRLASDTSGAWLRLPRLSEEEVLNLTGPAAPLGYTLGESTLTVHPTTDDTYTVRIVYWAYSADWAFTSGEEPYLAKYAWLPIIQLATSFGLASFGEHADAAAWEKMAGRSARDFFANEMARAMHNEDLTLRVMAGAADRRPSRRRGWGEV